MTAVKILGGAGEGGASPHRLLVSTVGDELKMSDGGKSRVIGISLKDRSAILPVGPHGQRRLLVRPQDRQLRQQHVLLRRTAWLGQGIQRRASGRPLQRRALAERKYFDRAGEKLYNAVCDSPFGNELMEAFAERAVEAEQLGQRDVTDLLAVSFSSNDTWATRRAGFAGSARHFGAHRQGPGQAVSVSRRASGNGERAGGDDGGSRRGSPVPEVNQARKMPGGRMPPRIVRDTVQAALAKKYGEGNWISSPSEHSLYLNLDLIREKKLDRAEVNRAAAEPRGASRTSSACTRASN